MNVALQNLLGTAFIVGIVTLSLALTGCDVPLPPRWEPNQSKRHTFFLECLRALPAGPQSTKYNDWDEVVEACQSASFHQSLYCVANCPPSPEEMAGAQ